MLKNYLLDGVKKKQVKNKKLLEKGNQNVKYFKFKF